MSKKILIAEDEKPMARVLKLKLEGCGFEVKMVHNGADALKDLENEKYDLLLLDLMMPVMGGFAVLENLKNQDNEIPVIISSNLGQNEDVEKAKNLGAIDYFVKSDTTINDVVDHVKKALNIE